MQLLLPMLDGLALGSPLTLNPEVLRRCASMCGSAWTLSWTLRGAGWTRARWLPCPGGGPLCGGLAQLLLQLDASRVVPHAASLLSQVSACTAYAVFHPLLKQACRTTCNTLIPTPL